MPDVMEAPASVAPSAPVSSPEPSSPAPLSPSAPVEHLGPEAGVDFDIRAELDAKLDSPVETHVPKPTEAPVPEPRAETKPEPEPLAATPEPAEERTPVADDKGELPDEGVKVEVTRSGQKQFVLDENRYNTIQNAYRTARMAEETLGEPLTQEVLTELQGARVDLHSIESSLLSSNPAAQANILQYFANLSQAARDSGEIGHDPMVNLAATMPQFLAQRAPEAYQAQANTYLRNILDNIYRQTAGKTDKKSEWRFAAAQHIDEWVFDRFSNPEDIKIPDPMQARLSDIQAREQQLNSRMQQESTQRWNQAISTSNQQVKSKVEGVVASILKPVESHYEKFPKALGDTRSALVGLVNDAISKDKPWQSVRDNLLREARETTSEQRRSELLKQIETRYEAKAKIVLDPIHNPEVRARLNQGAAKVVAEANATAARAENGAKQRQPSGGGATPQRSVLPAPTAKPGLWSFDEVHDDILAKLS